MYRHLLLLILLAARVSAKFRRPPPVFTTSASPSPVSLAAKATWDLNNYTANVTEVPTFTKPSNFSSRSIKFFSLLIEFGVSPTSSGQGHVTSVEREGTTQIGFVTSTPREDVRTKILRITTLRPEEGTEGVTTSTAEGTEGVTTAPPEGSEGVIKTPPEGTSGVIITLPTDKPTENPTDNYTDIQNGTSVCLFDKTRSPLIDVMVYAILDVVLSGTSIILLASSVISRCRLQSPEDPPTHLDKIWRTTYLLCSLCLMTSSLLHLLHQSLPRALDYVTIALHLLRAKTLQLLLARTLLGKDRVPCFVGTLLWVVDLIWVLLIYFLSLTVVSGCPLCQRNVMKYSCLSNNLLNVLGIAGCTFVFCVVSGFRRLCRTDLVLSEEGDQEPGQYSSIPQENHGGNSSQIVYDAELTKNRLCRILQFRRKYGLNIQNGLKLSQHFLTVVFTFHLLFSMLFIFGFFTSNV